MSEKMTDHKNAELLPDKELDKVNGGLDLRSLVYRGDGDETLSTLEYRGEGARLTTLEMRGQAAVLSTLEQRKKGKKKKAYTQPDHLINL